MSLEKSARIFVAGHRGLVGSAVVRALGKSGYENLSLQSRRELNLLDQSRVEAFFALEKIDAVVLAAARVGGIAANASQPVEFLYENLTIATNVVHAAAKRGVKRLLFLGSSCIYPRLAPQPISESSLLTGPLEPTNEAYAIAKIAGLKLCEYYNRQHGLRYVSAMPTNLYGPNDRFEAETSHVIPGLMRRFHRAKLDGAREVVVWGSGKPLREFLHADDLASALVTLLEDYRDPQFVNVGSGVEVSIADLAREIKDVVGFKGELRFDASRPDGTPRKIMDSSRVRAMNWRPRVGLREGLAETYRWAVEARALD